MAAFNENGPQGCYSSIACPLADDCLRSHCYTQDLTGNFEVAYEGSGAPHCSGFIRAIMPMIQSEPVFVEAQANV